MKSAFSICLPICFLIILVGCTEKSATVGEKSKEASFNTSVEASQPQKTKKKSDSKKKPQIPEIKKTPIEARLYGGQKISHWKITFKTLDCESSIAVQSVDGLIEIVRDEDLPWFTRKQAGRLLGKIGLPARKAIPVLIGLIQNTKQNEETATWSLQSLAEFAVIAKSATPEISKIALDRNRTLSLRIAAINALSRIGSSHPEVIFTLEKLLDARPRRDANTIQELWQLKKSAAEALIVIGPDASSTVPVLVKAIRRSSKNEEVRIPAIRALGAMGAKAEQAISVIAQAMVFDNISAVRDVASQALGEIGPTAIPILLGLIANATTESKVRIARSLGAMGASAKEALENLDLLLDDDDGHVRISAAIAIWKISRDERQSVPAIVLELTNADRHVRRIAYEQLLKLEFSSAIVERALAKLEKDERGYVRAVVKKVLKSIRSRK